MGPATGQLNAGACTARCDQAVVTSVTIDLQDTAQTQQYPFVIQSPPTGGMGEGHIWRCYDAPRSIIAGKCPEPSGPCLSRARIENRRAGLICDPADDCRAIGREGMNSFEDRFRSAIRASKTGRHAKAARSTQHGRPSLQRVDRSRLTP